MGKLLSWVVLIALAWLVLHLVSISQRRRERSRGAPAGDAAASSGGEAARSSGRTLEGEPIVPCAHCGLFVPASDAVRDGELIYCSTAHREADRASRRSAGEGPGRRPRSRDE
ncbi:MAG TPA: PP0621 family protein [Zeimonas sp.]